MDAQQQIRLQGFAEAAKSRRILQAGPLSAEFDQGALRNIRMGSILVLQQIYSAVRDHNWGTGNARYYNPDGAANKRFTPHCVQK